jgi:hypothetical protein
MTIGGFISLVCIVIAASRLRAGGPAGARDFSCLHNVQTVSGTDLVSAQWVLGVKWRGLDSDHRCLVQRLRMIAVYLHSPIRLYGIIYYSQG